MKKLVFLFAAVVLTAISAKTFAQTDSGTTPAQGSTHNYSVTPNGSNTYSWYTTKGGLTGTQNEDVTFSPVAANTASVNITWAATASTTTSYYLHVVETDATTGCTNEKVKKIDPIQSQFYLTIASNKVSTTCYYNGNVAITLDVNGQPVYDHGNATITYTVTPTGTGSTSTGYSFSFANAIEDYAANAAILPTDFAIVSATVTSGNGSATLTGASGGGTVNVTDNNPVTIQFVIDHVKTYANTDNAAVSEFTSVVTISGGETANGVDDNGSSTAYSADFMVTRPHTATIITD